MINAMANDLGAVIVGTLLRRNYFGTFHIRCSFIVTCLANA